MVLKITACQICLTGEGPWPPSTALDLIQLLDMQHLTDREQLHSN